ncbi:MAG: hypothetical protein WD894_07375 [Pirellulales bacterium]
MPKALYERLLDAAEWMRKPAIVCRMIHEEWTMELDRPFDGGGS